MGSERPKIELVIGLLRLVSLGEDERPWIIALALLRLKWSCPWFYLSKRLGPEKALPLRTPFLNYLDAPFLELLEHEYSVVVLTELLVAGEAREMNLSIDGEILFLRLVVEPLRG